MRPVRIDQYLTNGIKLFRVDKIREEENVVELEDCATNEILPTSLGRIRGQINAKLLRPVEPLQKGTEGLVAGNR